MEVGVNIFLYGYILTCIAYLGCECEYVLVWIDVFSNFYCSEFYLLFCLYITHIIWEIITFFVNYNGNKKNAKKEKYIYTYI